MATLTLQAAQFCEAGNHFVLTATGDVSFSAPYSLEEFKAPITAEEKAIFLKLLVRFAKIGRTNAQVKAALISGAVVTL